MVQGRKVGKAVITTLCAQYYWRVLQLLINLMFKISICLSPFYCHLVGMKLKA